MTVEETAEVLAVIKAGIPNAYLKLTDADTSAMVMLWAEMFSGYSKDMFMAAAKTYIWSDTSGRFPSPGAIREHMSEIEKQIETCGTYGYTLAECGIDKDKYPPAVTGFIEREYRKRYKQLTGRDFVGQIERMLLSSGTDAWESD